MAKKKRKKRPRQGPPPAKQQMAVAAGRSGRGGKSTATAATAQETRPARAPARPQPSARSTDRRERKEEARRARERALRRYQRGRLLRRGLVVTGVVGAVVLAVLFFQRQNKVANATIAAGDRAAEAAKCSSVKDEPLDPSYNGAPHLTPGEPAPNYNTNPPTSGRHNPSPLPPSPHVYQEEVPATQAVHNLEHGYVVMYYRKSGKEKLPAPVIAALERYANGQKKVLLAPLDSLEEGTSYALTAWTHLQECPGAVTSNQAVTIAKGFVQRFRGSSSVPEPNGA